MCTFKSSSLDVRKAQTKNNNNDHRILLLYYRKILGITKKKYTKILVDNFTTGNYNYF